VKTAKAWGWKRWAKGADEYLAHLEALLAPDLFIVGGGLSKDFAKFGGLLHTRAEVVPAQLANDAGIVGAAQAAAR